MSDEYIDAEYNDVPDRIINGEPLFYSTIQVAELVGVDASTIRYWSKRFDNLLDIQVSNKNKQYRKSDISKLKFIKKLAKEDGLSLQQVEDYCSTKGFNLEDIENAVLDQSNPLAVQVFTSAVMSEINQNLNSFAEKLLAQIDEKNKNHIISQQELNEKLREEIVTTVDEVVSEKLDTKLTELKDFIDAREIEATKRDNEMIDIIKNNMEQKKEESVNEKKGFFTNIFGKRK